MIDYEKARSIAKSELIKVFPNAVDISIEAIMRVDNNIEVTLSYKIGDDNPQPKNGFEIFLAAAARKIEKVFYLRAYDYEVIGFSNPK